MKKLLFTLFLFIGCVSPKQIATCVQTCESINAQVLEYNKFRNDKGVECICVRKYLIDEAGTTTIEETPK